MMLLKSVSVRSRSVSYCCYVGRTDMVFAILWFSELVDEELYAVRRRPQEAKAP